MRRLCVLVVAAVAALGIDARAQSTAWTYQGELRASGQPAAGAADLRLRLYDAASAGSQVGPQVDRANVALAQGRFTIEVDFGAGAFGPEARWLEIDVRSPAGSGPYVTLAPRQKVTAAPAAQYAASAGNAATASSATSATNAAQLNGQSGAFYQNASNMNAGLVPDARLAAQIVRAGGDTTFTGTNLFSGANTFTHAGNVFAGDGAGLRGLWRLGGNAGTNPASEFLGTTDSTPLELRVNGARGVRLEYVTLGGPGTWGVNVLAGASNNSIGAGLIGGTVAGGGLQDAGALPNTVTGHFGTVGGGRGNTAGQFSVVPGGSQNTASGAQSAVGGGVSNLASAVGATVGGGALNHGTGQWATVAGGSQNTAGGEFSVAAGGQANAVLGAHAVVAGGQSNQASAAHAAVSGGLLADARARFSAIGGGGPADMTNATTQGNTNNRTFDEYCVVSGGGNNWAGSDDGNATSAPGATISGGLNNRASAIRATIGGGRDNVASGGVATIGGGNLNQATSIYATIGGGISNTASGDYAVIAGGRENSITAFESAIGGGRQNQVAGTNAVIGGGYLNQAGSAFTTVGGGRDNRATADFGSILGGDANRASGIGAAVLGGGTNVASGLNASVAGGFGNTASGNVAHVAGGASNLAQGVLSLAAGNRARALHTGAFVWADSQNADLASTGDNQFIVRAAGGVGINTATPTSTLHVNGSFAAGSKAFIIDHPLDPEGKYLMHSCVESPDMKNVYDGVVRTDADGIAIVQLPEWFAALNGEYRYQLTVIDEAAPDVHFARVARRIGTDGPNQFTIRTVPGNLEVSWQVTGIRQDPFARENRIQVEVDKPGSR